MSNAPPRVLLCVMPVNSKLCAACVFENATALLTPDQQVEISMGHCFGMPCAAAAPMPRPAAPNRTAPVVHLDMRAITSPSRERPLMRQAASLAARARGRLRTGSFRHPAIARAYLRGGVEKGVRAARDLRRPPRETLSDR